MSQQSFKLDDYQQRAVVQIEKYQLLTERSAAEREELQMINKSSKVIFSAQALQQKKGRMSNHQKKTIR